MRIGIGLGTALGGNSSARAYSITADPVLMAWYRPDTGLTNRAVNPALGPLVETGGAFGAGTDADGNPTWTKAKGDGKSMAAQTLIANMQYIGAFTVIAILKFTGTPALGDRALNISNMDTSLFWSASNQVRMIGSVAANIPATPANQSAYIIYPHNVASRASVNGAAYSTINLGQAQYSVLNRLVFGNGGFTTDASCDYSEVMVFRGQLSAAQIAGLASYIRGRYPSMGYAASGPVPFSLDQTSRGALPVGPFKVIVGAGQSNESSTYLDSATVAPAGAGVYQLGNDNTITALQRNYDANTNALDGVSDDSGTTNGGRLIKMANDYYAATGIPVLIVPCMAGASGFAGNNIAAPRLRWESDFPDSTQQRYSLFGSAVARTKNALALAGAQYGWLDMMIGESACAFLTPTAAFGVAYGKMIADFHAAIGQPVKAVLQPICNTMASGTAPNIALVQSMTAALAVPGQILVNTPWGGTMSADNIHLSGAGADATGAQAAALAVAAGF
jgi:hypothetical protein